MRPKLKLVSEEIVRWAFEVSLHKSDNWKIAFTNPTAGPWKRVMALNPAGAAGEVHRFEIDEKRPDLIIYSDKYKVVVIVEAKPDLGGLSTEEQIEKTSALYGRLSSILKTKKNNAFWGGRSEYRYELGLLWGKKNETAQEVKNLATRYHRNNKSQISDVICIRGITENESIEHKVFWGISDKKISMDAYQS